MRSAHISWRVLLSHHANAAAGRVERLLRNDWIDGGVRHGQDAGQRLGLRRIDEAGVCMGMGTARDPAVDNPCSCGSAPYPEVPVTL